MKASLNSIYHQTGDWLRETDFYKLELSILQKRLEEIAAKNTAQDVLAEVEHFQNKFILLKEELDILAHDLNRGETEIDNKIKQMPEHTNEKFVSMNGKMQQRMKTFASGFADLRFEFNSFLSKVM